MSVRNLIIRWYGRDTPYVPVVSRFYVLMIKDISQWLKNGHSVKKYIKIHFPKHFDDICSYLIYHDCGKPFCLIIDDNGKRHFPNHAMISKNTFLQYSSNQFIANLIEKDMLCHITKPKDYLSLVYEPYIELLLCSALAELHSNASMFGGFASDSFKIKFKNLDKLGQRILDAK